MGFYPKSHHMNASIKCALMTQVTPIITKRKKKRKKKRKRKECKERKGSVMKTFII